MKLVAIVGMAGSGKSEVSRVFEENGFQRIRFGDITDEEMKKRGLERNEQNERYIRELLRKEYGMSAYAYLNLPRIDLALQDSDVVMDGLYSWEEYMFFKEKYPEVLCAVAVYASPETRYRRLEHRRERPLTPEQAASRDRSEIENTNKGGPIAMADFTIVNEYSLPQLKQDVKRVIELLK